MFARQDVFEPLPDRPFAHCVNLTNLGDAGLVAIWMGGSYETAPDVALLTSRLLPGARTWTPPEVLLDVDGHSLGQPVLLPRPDGELWLFFVEMLGTSWETVLPRLVTSSDGGRSWGTPRPLFDMPGLMLRSRAHVLGDRILLPAYDENTWRSHMLISDDAGATWRLTAPMESPQGNIHPTVVELPDGQLLCYLRTGGASGVLWRSTSADRGDTWSELTPTAFPNANTGLDLLRLDTGQHLLAFNDSPTHRTPLCVALTRDADEDWAWQQLIDDEFVELSYPCAAQTADGTVHLLYTHDRRNLRHASFDIDWVRQGVER